MKKIILKHMNAISGIAACLLISGVTMSFQDTPFVNQIMDTRIGSDTVPDKFTTSTMNLDDLDKIIIELDDEMMNVDVQLKEVDMDAVRKQIEMSLKEIDVAGIMKNVEESLNNIDLTKMMAEIKLSLSELDGDHKAEIKESMEEVQKELEKAKEEMKNINREGIRRELQEAKAELENAKKELKEIDMDKIRKEAKTEIEKARTELKLTKQMFSEMEKDGLINPAKGFSIDFSSDELYINDVKQPKGVADKFRKYIKGDHFKIRIEKK